MPANHDLNASGEKNKAIALAFIQSYGNALTSGSTTGYNSLVDKYMTDSVNDYDTEFKKLAKERTSKAIRSDIEINDSQVITKYAGILKNATINDVKFDTKYSDKSSGYTTLQYYIDLPGFFISKFNHYLEFQLDNKTNTYLLTGANM
ncbi:hypothetical protein A8L34_14255 [Bacillus sp. FJAT-27264]|nr:hypothetical protein A8L34_14255 [Bacillus sp. FJAT-27264]